MEQPTGPWVCGDVWEQETSGLPSVSSQLSSRENNADDGSFPLTAVCPGMTGFGQNQNPGVSSVCSKTRREGQALSETRGIGQAARKVADIPAHKAPDEFAGAATRRKLFLAGGDEKPKIEVSSTGFS